MSNFKTQQEWDDLEKHQIKEQGKTELRNEFRKDRQELINEIRQVVREELQLLMKTMFNLTQGQ